MHAPLFVVFVQNRVIIELDPKDNVSAAITSSTHDRKSRCNIFFKNQKVRNVIVTFAIMCFRMCTKEVSPHMMFGYKI